jgi:hypothetical protein
MGWDTFFGDFFPPIHPVTLFANPKELVIVDVHKLILSQQFRDKKLLPPKNCNKFTSEISRINLWPFGRHFCLFFLVKRK